MTDTNKSNTTNTNINMKPYFEKQLANTWKRWVKKGRRSGGTLGYFHLIAVNEDNTVTFSVSTKRITPSGVARSGSKKRYGEITIHLEDGLDATINAAAEKI